MNDQSVEADEPQKTPVERNSELRALYQKSLTYRTSFFSGGGIPSADESLSRHITRGNAEIPVSLANKLSQLLERANTTEGFKKYAVLSFRTEFFAGLGPDGKQDIPLPQWLGPEGSAGVYDENTNNVMALEKIEYKRACELETSWDEPPEDVGKTLSEWKEELKIRYGEEP